MPCKRYVRCSKKKTKKMKLKQVRESCRKLALQIIYIYMLGGPITQFLPRAVSFLVTPLLRGHIRGRRNVCWSPCKVSVTVIRF
jgi:hypothetical protein